MEAIRIISVGSTNMSFPAAKTAKCDQRLRQRPTICSLKRDDGRKHRGLDIVHANALSTSGEVDQKEKDEGMRCKITPDSRGRFGCYGGQFVPEILISPLRSLEDAFNKLIEDSTFQMELQTLLRDYGGRESPLYYAERLSNYYKQADGKEVEIYLKREDLTHTGAHKINNAIGQALVAKRLGYEHVTAATGAGQHGVATAAACARLGMKCTVYTGTKDMERQPHNLRQMKALGAEVKSVEGNFKDATSQAIRHWVSNLETSFYLSGSLVGPHPCPSMVREFQSVVGKEVRKQAMERWRGNLPDVLVACVGSGSNAMGLFDEFLGDQEVRLIGVEAAGLGLASGRHAATLARGELGVYHGSMSYLLQDDYGQIVDPHSRAVGMEYPGVGPQLSFLKDIGRVEYYTVTDQEALNAFRRLCALEGIIPALEASHALAFLEELCPTLRHGTRLVVNISGRGDKDIEMILQHLPTNQCQDN